MVFGAGHFLWQLVTDSGHVFSCMVQQLFLGLLGRPRQVHEEVTIVHAQIAGLVQFKPVRACCLSGILCLGKYHLTITHSSFGMPFGEIPSPNTQRPPSGPLNFIVKIQPQYHLNNQSKRLPSSTLNPISTWDLCDYHQRSGKWREFPYTQAFSFLCSKLSLCSFCSPTQLFLDMKSEQDNSSTSLDPANENTQPSRPPPTVPSLPLVPQGSSFLSPATGCSNRPTLPPLSAHKQPSVFLLLASTLPCDPSISPYLT